MYISNEQNVSRSIRSFAMDAMLVAEKDYNGEYTSKSEVEKALQEIE